MLSISSILHIPESDLTVRFIRSAGPGGQNVNKVSTAVQLRFNLIQNSSLPVYVRDRLFSIGRSHLNKEGELVITANRFRSQDQNRSDALERLKKLVLSASFIPKKRKKTKPSRRGKERRLQGKKHRGEIKRLRRKPSNRED